jgi:membrane fusion protein (multidrug efflux system)
MNDSAIDNKNHVNDHGKKATSDDETCHDRSLTPVPPLPMGEGYGSALREFHVNRKKWMSGLLIFFLLIAIGYAIHWYVTGRNFEYSDDAYVATNIVQITPQVAGTAVAIAVNESDFVKAGDVLVSLDDTNASIALQLAEAELAQTVREVRALYAVNLSLSATLSQRHAQLDQASNDLLNAQADFSRRQPLSKGGAVSGEELQHAQTALNSARSQMMALKAALNTAQQQLRGNEALTSGMTVDNHFRVVAAADKVKLAYLDWQRSQIKSPIEGYVGKRNVQLGQRIAIGMPIMTIVPLKQIWVEANFKEVQLRYMRIGQSVALTADLYGNQVEYHGRVSGIDSGTGAAFALLPAQNATGNWIKVVQRIPVRITLDSAEVVVHPLRVGMSMEVTVNVSGKGVMLADAMTPKEASQTLVYRGAEQKADALIAQIISRNLAAKP